MTKRDPRIDPRPGDVFEKAGKRLVYTRTFRGSYLGDVLYQDGNGQICAARRGSFLKWAKCAEVLHVAD